jgi:hypothetical protein
MEGNSIMRNIIVLEFISLEGVIQSPRAFDLAGITNTVGIVHAKIVKYECLTTPWKSLQLAMEKGNQP